MTRVSPLEAWSEFCTDSHIYTDKVDWALPHSFVDAGSKPSVDMGMVAEWQPAGFTLRRVEGEWGFNVAWIAPRHSVMAKIPTEAGISEYNSGPAAMLGELQRIYGGGPANFGKCSTVCDSLWNCC